MIIYDASALFNAIIKKEMETEAFILDLTLYEAGNIVVKHALQMKDLPRESADSALVVLANWMRIIYVQQYEVPEIFKTASSLGLTFYDAAYVYFSKKYNATLLTADSKLHEKASTVCRTELTK